MSVTLKIKAKHLASESRIIKHEERKFLKQARPYEDIRRECLKEFKENWKPEYERRVAARQRLIKARLGDDWEAQLASRRAKALAGHTKVREHRIHVVRVEARATHLARMYAKGVPYAMVEAKTHPCTKAVFDYTVLSKVMDMVSRHTDSNGTKDAIRAWYNASSKEVSKAA